MKKINKRRGVILRRKKVNANFKCGGNILQIEIALPTTYTTRYVRTLEIVPEIDSLSKNKESWP